MSGCEYFIGVDLRQTRDYAAIAVVERTDVRLTERDRVTWEFLRETRSYLRHPERVALGTSYPEVVRIVCDVVGRTEALGQCTLVVDATGVGAPVVDLLREARLNARVVAVTITWSDGVSRRPDGDWIVPKRDLVTRLQLMPHTERTNERSSSLKTLIVLSVDSLNVKRFLRLISTDNDPNPPRDWDQ